MLVSLHVRNMALIKETEVAFGEGLNILTGETGAGKSIIIGSVTVALGTGSFKDYVPEETDYSLVELIFETDHPAVLSLLRDAQIPVENGQVVISRKYQNGRSISRVNGESVPLSFVRELSADLIDIHGQHEHQSLLYPKFHLQLLDRYAKEELAAPLEECREQYRQYRTLSEELSHAVLDEAQRAKQMDLIAYEIREIENAALTEGEDEQLEEQYRYLSNAQRIRDALSQAAELISGPGGAEELFSRAVRALSPVSDVGENLSSLADEAAQTEDLLSGLSRDIAVTLDDLSVDEEEYYRMGQRLDLINHLKTKYGRTITEILAYRDEQQQQFDRLSDYEAYTDRLTRERDQAFAALSKTAGAVTALRKKAAGRLQQKIAAALEDLNFPDVRFEISFEQMEEPGANGQDRAIFLLSTNPGVPVRPLQDIASGGELSRVMLAIKSVMADPDAVETLIFDEIDTGISGRTAQKVAEKMALIADDRQVICITHLAQIAAMADSHFEITKETEEGRSTTKISLLNEEQSCRELARILGGARITDAVTQSAAEMKQLAAGLKEEKRKERRETP